MKEKAAQQLRIEVRRLRRQHLPALRDCEDLLNLGRAKQERRRRATFVDRSDRLVDVRRVADIGGEFLDELPCRAAPARLRRRRPARACRRLPLVGPSAASRARRVGRSRPQVRQLLIASNRAAVRCVGKSSGRDRSSRRARPSSRGSLRPARTPPSSRSGGARRRSSADGRVKASTIASVRTAARASRLRPAGLALGGREQAGGPRRGGRSARAARRPRGRVATVPPLPRGEVRRCGRTTPRS